MAKTRFVGTDETRFTFTDVAVGAALAEVARLPVLRKACGLTLEIKNTDDAVALTDLELKGRAHPDGDWITLLSGTDWADDTIRMLAVADSSLPLLAAGGSAFVGILCETPMDLSLWAAGDGAVLDIFGRCTGQE